MIARVRGVIAASIASGSRLNVVRSISANTGTALASMTAEAVEKKVYGGTITSSWARIPAASSAIRNETVPLTTAIPCLQPCFAAKRFSNLATSRPSSLPQLPLRSTSSNRFSSVLPKTGQAGKGRVRTGLPPSRASLISNRSHPVSCKSVCSEQNGQAFQWKPEFPDGFVIEKSDSLYVDRSKFNEWQV